MEASVLDLRYKMKNVLKALDRNESVRILYHGKEKGIITPTGSVAKNLTSHPYFGMNTGSKKSVATIMKNLRDTRYKNDL